MHKYKLISLFLISIVFCSCNIQQQCERNLRLAKLNCPELFTSKVDTFYKIKIDTVEKITIDTLIFYRDISDSELIAIKQYNDSIYKIILFLQKHKGSVLQDSTNLALLKHHVIEQEKYILLLKYRLKNACKDLIINKEIERTIKKDSTTTLQTKNTAIIQDDSWKWLEFLVGLGVGFVTIFCLIWVNKKVNKNE